MKATLFFLFVWSEIDENLWPLWKCFLEEWRGCVREKDRQTERAHLLRYIYIFFLTTQRAWLNQYQLQYYNSAVFSATETPQCLACLDSFIIIALQAKKTGLGAWEIGMQRDVPLAQPGELVPTCLLVTKSAAVTLRALIIRQWPARLSFFSLF